MLYFILPAPLTHRISKKVPEIIILSRNTIEFRPNFSYKFSEKFVLFFRKIHIPKSQTNLLWFEWSLVNLKPVDFLRIQRKIKCSSLEFLNTRTNDARTYTYSSRRVKPRMNNKLNWIIAVTMGTKLRDWLLFCTNASSSHKCRR